MKYCIALCAAIVLLSSCKKNEVPKSAGLDSTAAQDSAAKTAVENLRKNRKTPRAALDALINLPGGGPIPSHLSPPKDIQLVSQTDSTTSFSFVSGSTGAKAKIELRRAINGTDTSWFPGPAVEIR